MRLREFQNHLPAQLHRFVITGSYLQHLFRLYVQNASISRIVGASLVGIVGLVVGFWMLENVVPLVGEAGGSFIAFLFFVAGPLAILQVNVIRLVIRLIRPWFLHFTLKPELVPLPADGVFTFSIARLFSLSALPYRLYPVSCCLLE